MNDHRHGVCNRLPVKQWEDKTWRQCATLNTTEEEEETLTELRLSGKQWQLLIEPSQFQTSMIAVPVGAALSRFIPDVEPSSW